MATDKILIIGANGQIGSALLPYLRALYGEEQVIAADIRRPTTVDSRFELLDASDAQALAALVRRLDITQIYHLAAILSANGEADPLGTWDINTRTFLNVLEVARTQGVQKVFFPSSIAVFGPNVNREAADQFSYLAPTTTYGLSKAACENWAAYYFHRYGLDIRSLRYPGIISHETLPGGGTTDYAVDIFHKAVLQETFTCFLKQGTVLPMIYMEDALLATLQLMEAPASFVRIRTSYNLQGFSCSPEAIVSEIRNYFPKFKIIYAPDFRQAIADSWPRRVDDIHARNDWGWKARFQLDAMTVKMLTSLEQRYGVTSVLSGSSSYAV